MRLLRAERCILQTGPVTHSFPLFFFDKSGVRDLGQNHMDLCRVVRDMDVWALVDIAPSTPHLRSTEWRIIVSASPAFLRKGWFKTTPVDMCWYMAVWSWKEMLAAWV